MVGRTDWFDLFVTDLADAMSFYEGLLGWTYRQMENSPLADYVMIEADGELIGGLRRVVSAHEKPSPMALILYFTVENLPNKITRAKELGAEIIGQTVELGKDRGRYQWIRDRAGHVIGLWSRQ